MKKGIRITASVFAFFGILFSAVFLGLGLLAHGQDKDIKANGVAITVNVTHCDYDHNSSGSSTSTTCYADYDFQGHHYGDETVSGNLTNLRAGTHTAKVSPNKPSSPVIGSAAVVSWIFVVLGGIGVTFWLVVIILAFVLTRKITSPPTSVYTPPTNFTDPPSEPRWGNS